MFLISRNRKLFTTKRDSFVSDTTGDQNVGRSIRLFDTDWHAERITYYTYKESHTKYYKNIKLTTKITQ